MLIFVSSLKTNQKYTHPMVTLPSQLPLLSAFMIVDIVEKLDENHELFCVRIVCTRVNLKGLARLADWEAPSQLEKEGVTPLKYHSKLSSGLQSLHR